jgi:hypothetical protein
MEAKDNIQLLSLEPYRALFPAARVVDKTVNMGATVSDTVAFIPQVVAKTSWQVEQFVKLELQGLNTFDACEKLWHFVKQHIRYKKDVRGLEQVRSARRLIHDGVGDCDCFTTFISTCLAELKIPVVLRITKYAQDFFQHIYPIVPLGGGRYITMDCVVSRFNYEEPYTEKQDTKMELQFLDGIDDELQAAGIDAQDLLGRGTDLYDLGELGKLLKRKSGEAKKPLIKLSLKPKSGKPGILQKTKAGIKKTLHVVNRVNPATALLRAGILASMKLNVLKVAARLKWAYLSDEDARKKGVDMARFGKLKTIKTKMEQIFFGAGGKPENLKKAILTGKGNKNKEVSGLGMLYGPGEDVWGLDHSTPMPQLLGADIYHSELVDGLEGLGELGEPATGAALAAASSAMAIIAGLLKSIGNLFPGKKGGDFAEGGEELAPGTTPETIPVEPIITQTESPADESSYKTGTTPDTNEETTKDDTASTPLPESGNEEMADYNSATDSPNGAGAMSKTSAPSAPPPNTTSPQGEGLKGFWDNNKKWLKPLGIGLGAATVLYIGYRMTKGSDKKTAPHPSLEGLPTKQKKKKNAKKGKSEGKHTSIALM